MLMYTKVWGVQGEDQSCIAVTAWDTLIPATTRHWWHSLMLLHRFEFLSTIYTLKRYCRNCKELSHYFFIRQFSAHIGAMFCLSPVLSVSVFLFILSEWMTSVLRTYHQKTEMGPRHKANSSKKNIVPWFLSVSVNYFHRSARRIKLALFLFLF